MLVRQVEEGILQQLKSGQYAPGEKLPSLRELSREFGCSYVIAFRAVQSLKNSGYLETAKGNGIFVTGDARSKMEKKLIAYISARQDSSQLSPHDLIRYTCFQRIVRDAGFIDLSLYENEQLPSDQLDRLAGALITLDTPMMPELTARKIPCVFISSLGNPYGMPTATPDYYQGSFDVMQSLIKCGYRKIRAITLDSTVGNQASCAPRIAAYFDALNAAGLSGSTPLEWNIRKPELRKRFREAMSVPDHPDALFSPNDKMAIEIIQELSSMGFRVPDDIGVAGLENQEFFYGSNPPLTTASYDNEMLAREACTLLLRMIEQPSQNYSSITLPMTLIMRASSMPVKRKGIPA